MKRTSFIAMLVIAVLLRLLGLFSELWLDEVWALQAAANIQSPFDLWNGQVLDGHTSLYTLYLYFLDSQTPSYVLRMLSFICGLAGFWLVYLCSARDTTLEGLSALFLYSVSFVMVLYDSEARGYAAMLLGILICYKVLLGAHDKLATSSYLLFWAAAVIGFLFHYTFLLYYGGFVLWSFYCTSITSEKRLPLDRFLKLHALPCAFFFVFYMLYLRELGGGSGPIGSHLQVLLNTISIAFGGPLLSIYNIQIGAAVLCSCLVLLSVFVWAIWKLYRAGDDRWLLFFLMIFCVPLVVVLVVQPRVLAERYLLVSVLFSYFLFAKISHWLMARGLRGRIAVCLLATFFVIGNGVYLFDLACYGRGQYAEVLAEVFASSDLSPVTFGGDQDFRHEMMLSFYAPRLDGNLSYKYLAGFAAEESPENPAGSESSAPDWYLMHSQDRFFAPPSSLQLANQSYELKYSGGFAALSGWRLFAYQASKIDAE